MGKILFWVLTILGITAILGIRSKPSIDSNNEVKFSQTVVYEFMKAMILSGAFETKKTQSLIHSQSKPIRFVQTNEQKVYWLKDATVYVTDIKDGIFDPKTGEPIDATNLSKEELEKLLMILDALQNG